MKEIDVSHWPEMDVRSIESAEGIVRVCGSVLVEPSLAGACPHCGSATRVHSDQTRIVRDYVDACPIQIFARIPRRRCPSCRRAWCASSWPPPRQTTTNRMRDAILADAAEGATVVELCARYRIGHTTLTALRAAAGTPGRRGRPRLTDEELAARIIDARSEVAGSTVARAIASRRRRSRV